MGVNPPWVGYLRYCAQVGLGNYDLAKITLRGTAIALVQKKYRLNSDIDRQMRWLGSAELEDGSWVGPRGVRTDGRSNIR